MPTDTINQYHKYRLRDDSRLAPTQVLVVQRGSRKGERQEDKDSIRTKGGLRCSVHTPPYTLSLAFYNVLRRTEPGKR